MKYRSQQFRSQKRRAFTLVELLVTIAIIALLIALVITALAGVRRTASRAKSLSALRQMTTGYLSYATDHQRLLPGYINELDFDTGGAFEDLKVTLPDGYVFDFQNESDRLDAGSYVWRLAPYVGDQWKIMFEDYGSKSLITRLEEEFTGATPDLDGDEVYGIGSAGYSGGPPDDRVGIAHAPSYGLNSVMLGGDSQHGPPDIVDNHPWATDPSVKVAATMVSSVKSPSKMVTFAASVQMNPMLTPPQISSDEIAYGYATVLPPFLTNGPDALDAGYSNGGPQGWMNPQWSVQSISDGTYLVADIGVSGGIGVPISRSGGDGARTLDVNGQYVAAGTEKVPIARLDGSVDSLDAGRMAVDMSIWHWNHTNIISAGR